MKQTCSFATCSGRVNHLKPGELFALRLPALGRSASPQPLCCVSVQNQNPEFGGVEPGLHELREKLEQRLLEAQRYLTGTETAAGSGAMQREAIASRLLTCQVSPTHADRCVSSL